MEEQQKQRRRSVCLFGLSADPPTGMEGHLGIVRALQQQGEWDEVWVLPVYRHTFSVRRVNTCVVASEVLKRYCPNLYHDESLMDSYRKQFR